MVYIDHSFLIQSSADADADGMVILNEKCEFGD